MSLRKVLLKLKWETKARIPEPIKFWKEFLSLPFKKKMFEDSGLEPGEWEKDGFLCLCCRHINEFREEEDLDTAPTIGYHVCDKKGCGRTATHELMPELRRRLEEFDPESAIPLEEFREKMGEE